MDYTYNAMEAVVPYQKYSKFYFLINLQNYIIWWPISASLPTQKLTTRQFVVLWSHNTTIPTQNPTTQPIVVSRGSGNIGSWEYCCVVVF